jgi:hypothetical protein
LSADITGKGGGSEKGEKRDKMLKKKKVERSNKNGKRALKWQFAKKTTKSCLEVNIDLLREGDHWRTKTYR